MENNEVIVYSAGADSIIEPKNVICYLPDVSFKHYFGFYTLLKSLSFDRKFKSGRSTQLFGLSPYKYGDVLHSPHSFNT